MKYSPLMLIALIVFIAIFGGAANVAAAPPTVIDHFPNAFARGVARTAILTATFDTDLNPSTIDETTFIVCGSISGYITGSVSFNIPSRTASFIPDGNYALGEIITVTLTSGIESATAEPLAFPYSWSFYVKVNGGTGRFDFGDFIPATGKSAAVAIADFNNDGRLDITYTNHATNEVTVLTNNGDSTFSIDSTYPVGATPLSMCVGDFNHDGFMDIVAANLGSGDITTLVNLGDGSFQPQTPIPAGSGPRCVFPFDADGDGYMDLAAVNQTAGTISILLNDGAGMLSLDSSYFVIANIFYPYAADFDMDGKLDIVIAGNTNYKCFVLRNLGGGIFAPPVIYEMEGKAVRVAVAADFDGDGFADIATGDDGGTRGISVFLNLGDGTFGPEVIYQVNNGQPPGPFSMTVGDLDGDDDLDLATGDGGFGSTSIFLNVGDGSFPPARVYQLTDLGPYVVALCDLDDDGDLDLAASYINPPGVQVMLNRSPNAIDSIYPPHHALSATLGDSIVVFLNSDFDPATVNDSTFIIRSSSFGTIAGDFSYTSRTIVFLPDRPLIAGEEITVTMTDGIDIISGESLTSDFVWTFTAGVAGGVGDMQPPLNLAANSFPRETFPADLNGDGRLDLAVANTASNSISVWLNNGDSTYSNQIAGLTDRIPYSISGGDFDEDGDIDLVTGNIGDHSISVCYNNGSGLCESFTNIADGNRTASVSVADYNGDGHLDIAAGKVYSDSVYIYLNDGQGGFHGPGTAWYAHGGGHTVVSTDIDNDADIDLITAPYSDSNYICVLHNDATGKFTHSLTRTVLGHDAAIEDSAHTVFAGDFNGDGFADLAAGNLWAEKVSIILSDGVGSFSGATVYDLPSRPNSICGADFDGDGDMDLACAGQTLDGFVTILENAGDGTFTLYKDFQAGDSVQDVTSADIDGDGDVDIIATNGYSDNISILLNRDSIHVAPAVNPDVVSHGDSCLLKVNVAGDPDSVVLYYRFGGAVDWNSTALISADTVYQDMIPTDQVGVRSTAYHFKVYQRDNVETAPEVDPERHPYYIQSQLVDATVPGIQFDIYQMIGFPFILNPGNPVSVLGDDLGDYGYTTWRMGRWNPDKLPEPGYDDYTEIDSLSRGEGFWLCTRVGVHLDANGLSAVPDNVIGDTAYASFVIKPGWNQIATPFAFPLLWTHRIAESGIESVIYGYAAGGDSATYLSVDTMKAYTGYFLKNDTTVERTLLLPYVRAELMPSAAPPVPEPGVYFWQAQLAINSGNVSDISNFIGVREDAVDGRDCYDFSEPPIPPGQFVSLGFINENADGREVLFAGDFKKPDRGAEFEVLVRGNVEEPVQLQLTDASLLPPEFSTAIIDPSTGQSYSIPRNGAVTLPGLPTLEGKRYRLLVGDEDFIAGQSHTGAAIPETYRLSQNYPNPFNPVTTIDFELPMSSSVRLDIFNILGQRTATLVQNTLPAGKYSVTWDGKDNDGRAVASGIYFYRLKAGDFTARRKMLLLK